jgi:uncharacterized cupin superfamily protein
VKRINVASEEAVLDPDDAPGFRAARLRLGPALGAAQLGASVWVLPPRQAICPYHYEYGEEEWLLVLEGRPTIRHPDGEDQLEPWDAVCFASGPSGAHAVRNDSDEAVRLLMFSNVLHPAATVYPDSDKIAVWTGNRADDVIVHRTSAVDYWSGEAGGGTPE